MPTASIYAERFFSQGLSGPPTRDPAAVAERLLAVQGQDPRGARLAVRARSEGLTAADVDRAFTEERSLLITWLNRGTLHLVRSEDYPLLQALTTPPLHTSCARRLRQEGVSAEQGERAVETITGALKKEGALTRHQLRERLDSAAVPTAGQALIHLLFLAAVQGVVVRGPMIGKDHAYVLVRDWLGRQPKVDREAALAELARPTSSATRRPTIATSPAGPGCRCVTRATACRRSPRSWSSGTTASSTSPRHRPSPRCPARACSALSTRCCSAGPRASGSSARTLIW